MKNVYSLAAGGFFNLVYNCTGGAKRISLCRILWVFIMSADSESIVYGCIKDAVGLSSDQERRRINRSAMLALPSAEQWPFLSQEMFAIPRIETSMTGYQTEVMHFGASYQAIEYEWEEWLKAFEDLLAKMYWVDATVHLETELSGNHTFSWSCDGDFHTPGSKVSRIRCQWQHETGL